MRKNFLKIFFIPFIIIGFTLLNSCMVSYKLNGASIDYSKTKSISIADFPNMAELVHPPLANMFSENLRDKYTRQTRLQLLRTGGDMDLQGEIVGYDIGQLAVGTDGYASETRLTLTINVRFTNVKNPEEDFEKRYSANRNFPASKQLEEVQDDLLTEMVNDITDEIYNDTVARW